MVTRYRSPIKSCDTRGTQLPHQPLWQTLGQVHGWSRDRSGPGNPISHGGCCGIWYICSHVIQRSLQPLYPCLTCHSPTIQSISSTLSPYSPCRLCPWKSGDVTSGVCTCRKDTNSRKGPCRCLGVGCDDTGPSITFHSPITHGSVSTALSTNVCHHQLICLSLTCLCVIHPSINWS